MTKVFINPLDGNVYFIIYGILYNCAINDDNSFDTSDVSNPTELAEYHKKFITDFLNDDNKDYQGHFIYIKTHELLSYIDNELNHKYKLNKLLLA